MCESIEVKTIVRDAEGKSFAEVVDELVTISREVIYSSPSPTAIDWSKLKPIFANLLATFGPILIQILLGALEVKPTDGKQNVVTAWVASGHWAAQVFYERLQMAVTYPCPCFSFKGKGTNGKYYGQNQLGPWETTNLWTPEGWIEWLPAGAEAFQQLGSIWNTMSESDKASWTTPAESKNCSIYCAFCRHNQRRWMNGLDIVLNYYER